MSNGKELLKLIEENPNLPIVPMVGTEVVCDDSYRYWLGDWGSYYVGEYVLYETKYESRFFDDRADLKEVYYDDHYDEERFDGMTEEEIQAITDKEVDDMNWVKAIIVYIEAL